jgi:hypothetical protein
MARGDPMATLFERKFERGARRGFVANVGV